jgi:formylglycine-generating enzyme required for sulfatase activity
VREAEVNKPNAKPAGRTRRDFSVVQEYLAVMGSNPSFFNGLQTNFPAPPGGTNYGTDLTRPVEQVNWYDATNYCGQLTQRERAGLRIRHKAAHLYRLTASINA